MLQSILVPLDGSTFGEQALPLAMSIARLSGAKLTVMHVHQPFDFYYADLQPINGTLEESLRNHEKECLENVVRRLGTAGPVKVEAAFREGHVAAQVARQAVESNVDLVVMCTQARGPMGRFWLGSTADELVRELTIPLLLVHPSDQTLDITQAISLKNVLIPLDGTPLSEQILEPAISLAKLFQADITLLRVVRPLLPSVIPVGMGTFNDVIGHAAENVGKLQKQLEQRALVYLEKVAEKLRKETLIIKTQVALADQPGVGVLSEAQVLRSDLIAMETHGRRGLSRLFLGSVADKVLRGSPVPVLVYRPKH